LSGPDPDFLSLHHPATKLNVIILHRDIKDSNDIGKEVGEEIVKFSEGGNL